MAIAPLEAPTVGPSSTSSSLAGFIRSVRVDLKSFADSFTRDAEFVSTQALADTVAAIEELSRVVDHLQTVGAHALEQQNIVQVGESHHRFSLSTSRLFNSTTAAGRTAADNAAPGSPATGRAGGGGRRGTEFRDTAEYLRARLRISRSEAKRRLRVGSSVLAGRSFSGDIVPATMQTLGAATATGQISGQAATIIRDSLEHVRILAPTHSVQSMEDHLTHQALESDLDVLRVIARHWESVLDQDGREPSEELLRVKQGVFLRGTRQGLHRMEIISTADQFEHLITVMNTATNPRLHPPAQSHSPVTSLASGPDNGAADPNTPNDRPGVQDFEGSAPGEGYRGPTEPTRAQRLLDGLVGACRIALAAGALPATGGHRPQVMVTINYQDLAEHLHIHTSTHDSAGVPSSTQSSTDEVTYPRSHRTGFGSHRTGSGLAVFSGQISPTTVRKLACDADLIPVVLGGEGQVLDIGRARRLFPPTLRKALIARDKGCAFPDCTIPAPWCEAHHIISWEHGGSTSIDYGVLLCSSHHHTIHDGYWKIRSHDGIPWFIPPPYIDPHQSPRRNRYRLATIPTHQS